MLRLVALRTGTHFEMSPTARELDLRSSARLPMKGLQRRLWNAFRVPALRAIRNAFVSRITVNKTSYDAMYAVGKGEVFVHHRDKWLWLCSLTFNGCQVVYNV